MIREGAIVQGPLWPEPIEIKKVAEIGERVHIIGATIHSNQHIDQILSKEEMEKLVGGELILDFSAPASEVFLSLEALRYRYASLFDPFLAMNTSKIDPLPFQLDAVYLHALKLPRIRFMIADDPGAGKTIMAGLIIKELKLRGLARRVLIVSPGHLKEQWKRELKEKFQETFTVIDRGFLNTYSSESPWDVENQAITSIDFAKQNDVMNSLKSVEWDLVIVDEAHKMAAYQYGKKVDKKKRYRLGEVLSKTTEHLLFLTATPHKGDPESFRLLLDLLEPGFFAKTGMINDAKKNNDNPLFIRRIKEDLKDFDGKPIFTKRFTYSHKFQLSDDEMDLYNELSKYVIHQFNKALAQDNKRSFVFALLLLQRRMASSIYALHTSLKRKKEKYETILENPELLKEIKNAGNGEREDESEEERWEQELKWETSTYSDSLEELKSEIATLTKLIAMAETILDEGNETKLTELKKIMQKVGDEKLLIFTESKDTLDYILDKIEKWGYSANTIHGQMKMEQRVEAEQIFKKETQVMVATEAAGEGINLQFCHMMVNYDIPWNPNRLEQRMGRIHRYKQKKDVSIFNLVADNTREGMVLARVLDKLETIREAIGSDKVYDVIGEIFPANKLYKLVTDAVSGKSLDNIQNEIDFEVDEEYKEKLLTEVLEQGLASSIDYKSIDDIAESTKELRLVPEYVEEFFKKAFNRAGGKIKIRKDNSWVINSIPSDIRRMADSQEFRSNYGKLARSYPRITFDKDAAFDNDDLDYVSFGHPLLEALLKWVEEMFSDEMQRGGVFKDPSGVYDGVFWFFEGVVKDGKQDVAGKKIFAIYDDGHELKEVNPSLIWDFAPKDDAQPVLKEVDKSKPQDFVINSIDKYMDELKVERERQANVKRKYGLKSLEYFIGDIDADLSDYYIRQEQGENVDITIYNARERKKNYEIAIKKLKTEIMQEESLSMSMPKFLGAILVESDSDAMVTSKDIEMIGMEVTMEYERLEGREPIDVSANNVGFDVKSRDDNGPRYIEVKARKDEGLVELTMNEWIKAKRFKDQFWLYVVANAAKNPTLYIIQNPAEFLNASEKIEAVRFIVLPNEWKRGQKVLEKDN
ncbi:MAG: helicase-related protein [Methanobacteriaceae archaeon]|nr:helicase-related protein [Methanobacteriaceae archaeon]